MNARTKERKRWHKNLKSEWQHRPQICEFRFEGCTVTYMLTPAHSMKRRFIQTEAQYREIAIACLNCHRILDERMSHDEMRTAVKDAIQRRSL